MTTALPGTLELRPLHGDFGVEALGIDIAQPLAPAVGDAQRAAAPPVEQPLVRVHPPTGRNALYLGSHGQEFVGLSPLASRGLIERIMNHCTEPRFVYEHVWRAGDLVMWDNRATVHRGTEYDTATEPRVVRRTVLKGEAPIPA